MELSKPIKLYISGINKQSVNMDKKEKTAICYMTGNEVEVAK